MEENRDSIKDFEDIINRPPEDIINRHRHYENPSGETTEARVSDPGGEGPGPYRLYFGDFRKATLRRWTGSPRYGFGGSQVEVIEERYGKRETDIEKDTFEIFVDRNYLAARDFIYVDLYSLPKWLKTITAYDRYNRAIDQVWTDEMRQTHDVMMIRLSDIRPYTGAGGPLVFSKAKTWGRLTKMYHWDCEPLQPATRYIINWIKDG
jgi:hypothetical protein